MKKKAIIIFLMLAIFINYANADIVKVKNEALIIQAFEETGSELKSFNISYNGVVNDKFVGKIELEKICSEILESISFKEDYREVVEESKTSKLSIYGQVKDNQFITLVAHSYKGLDNKSKTSIFIDINENNDYKRTVEITSKLSEALGKQNIKPKITTCIVGAYDGQLEDKYKKEILKKIINVTQGRKIESLVNDDLTSYSLYSKNIENYIYSGTDKMNLNIAIRYDEYRNQTYIFIASPIITMGY